MTRALGFDTSRWNHDNDQPIDFQAAYDAGYRFWAGRLSVGNYYIDPWIVRDFAAASLTPLVKIVYHVPRTGLDVPSQIINMLEGLRQLPGTPDAIVLDMEGEDGKYTGAQITKCLGEHVYKMQPFWRNPIILYLNLNYLNNVLTSTFGLPIWISWPAAAGAYNPNPNPPVNNWLKYQRSFTHAIPGVPDPTVDLDEFNGDDAALFEYFGVEPEPGDDTVIEQKLDIIIGVLEALHSEAIAQTAELVGIRELLEGGATPPVDPPDPEPVPELWQSVIIGKDPRANAFFARAKNQAGKPIMSIYPSDSAPTYERVQFAKGQTVKVMRDATVADGGGEYYLIFPSEYVASAALFLRAIDLL